MRDSGTKMTSPYLEDDGLLRVSLVLEAEPHRFASSGTGELDVAGSGQTGGASGKSDGLDDGHPSLGRNLDGSGPIDLPDDRDEAFAELLYLDDDLGVDEVVRLQKRLQLGLDFGGGTVDDLDRTDERVGDLPGAGDPEFFADEFGLAGDFDDEDVGRPDPVGFAGLGLREPPSGQEGGERRGRVGTRL